MPSIKRGLLWLCGLGWLVLAACMPLALLPTSTELTSTLLPMIADVEYAVDLGFERIPRFADTLTFSISLVGEDCLTDLEQGVPVRLTFYNTTDMPVMFFKHFSQSLGDARLNGWNLWAQYAMEDGRSVGYGVPDIRRIVRPLLFDDFVEIPSKGQYETIFNVTFPSRIWLASTPSEKLSSGNYWLTLDYYNYDIGPSVTRETTYPIYDWNAWVGVVTSNAIKICVQMPAATPVATAEN